MAIIYGTIENDVTDGLLEADIIQVLAGDDTVRGFEENDSISGEAGNDFLNGNMGDDTVDGGEGDDIVRGGKNNDLVIGGAGNDTLFGDLGADILIGGDGADVFYLRRNSLGTDVVVDFTPGVDKFEFVDDLRSSDILMSQGTGANAADTIITDQVTGEIVAIVQGVSRSAIVSAFIPSTTPATENAGASTTTPSAQVTEQTNQLSSIEKAVVAEINRARTNPAGYADWLESIKQYFDGNDLKIPGRPSFTTTTGAAGFDEAIQYMKSVSPAPAVTLSNGLYLAARDHAQDLATNGGSISHVGTDGSTASDRMNRYGSFSLTSSGAGENIASASSSLNWPELFIMLMIVDDWEPTRGHRLNTMNPVFQEVGVACAPNTSAVTNCVMDFAAGYTDYPNLPPLAGIDDLSNDTLTDNINNNVFALQAGGENNVIANFEYGIDFMGLSNGVTSEQLEITPGDGATLINLNGQTLPSLTGVEASNISQDNFILI